MLHALSQPFLPAHPPCESLQLGKALTPASNTKEFKAPDLGLQPGLPGALKGVQRENYIPTPFFYAFKNLILTG